jgi:pyrimidine-specific ribonucleoside hydrolase
VAGLILDVDTGVDDALALLLAARCPSVRLLGVTCTGGNADVDQVVANTLAVLEVAGAPSVPVARGADRPLVEPPAATPRGHGRDGLADLGLAPRPGRRPVPAPAVDLLRTVLMAAAAPVTLVTLARLTNMALLLRAHPEAASRIGRLVVMGGAAGGPGSGAPEPEFNVASDPEAAALVFGSGLPLLMYGLDVFSRVTLGPADVDRLVAGPEPAARLAWGLLRHQQRRREDGRAGLGDAGAAAVAIRPALVRTRPALVRVGLAGEARGRTLVEPDPAGGIEVATTVDADACRVLFLDAVAG